MIKLVSVLNGVFTMHIHAATGESFTHSIRHADLLEAAESATKHLQPVIVEKFSTPIEFNWESVSDSDLVKLWATAMHRIDAAKASGFNALPMFYIPRVCINVEGISLSTAYILSPALGIKERKSGVRQYELAGDVRDQYGCGIILNAVTLPNGLPRVKGGVADERYLL